MKTSSFTHPHVVPNLYDFLSSVEHNIIYITALDPIDFYCMGKMTIILKLSFMFHRIKKVNFWVNCPFKCIVINYIKLYKNEFKSYVLRHEQKC